MGTAGPPASTAAQTRTPRVRSRVACQTCNRRKVRCNVAQTGPPCTNCRHDDQPCTVVPRKKHKPRRPRASNVSQAPQVAVATSVLQDASSVSVDVDGEQAESDDSERARALTPEADGRLPDDDAATYMGDNRGPRQSVYEMCHPQTPQESRAAAPQPSALLPARTAASWSSHEMAYLHHEGAFQALPADVYDDILRVYFSHVHFFMPILDVAAILRAHHDEGGLPERQPLLCWSMCLAAANFVPGNVLAKTSFRSRKAMKEAMYARAKCLYDLDRSTDKITLIQAVLLMGFWYTDAYDHTGAWHWVGIAISLAQSLGFHRKPSERQVRGSNGDVRDRRRTSLVRRIWWTCLVRDRWVALAKGRPMRIHDEDCDVPMPLSADLLVDFLEASGQEEHPEMDVSRRLLPARAQAAALARMWINMATISALLGRIVRAHYRVQGPPPRQEDIDGFERELQMYVEGARTLVDDDDDDGDGGGDLPDDHLLLHENHVSLFYNATVAILYRPYLLHAPASLPAGTSEAWQTRAARRARAAASRTNDILHRLIELDAIHLLKPMTITAIVPAMQIHLYDSCKAANPLLRSLGKNKLGLCLLVLSHIRNTYWSASVIHRLFSRAQQILQDASGGESGGNEAAETPTVAEVEQAQDQGLFTAQPTSTRMTRAVRKETRASSAREAALFHQQSLPMIYEQDGQHGQGSSYRGHDARYSFSGVNHNHSLGGGVTDMPTPAPTLTLTPTSTAPPATTQASYAMPPYLPNLPPPPPPSMAPSLPPPQPQLVQQCDTSWWDEPATFLNVDLLLSPGFALSDDVYQTLFQSYGAPEANGPLQMDMMYM
ncbi:hypothetical protein SCUCBS95973_009492 [Sporothrix curviconia]|uniref:Zn(2)-C6 fungal-type domain-containing protein n=1 Tax=Sporothrix curviconia TaxID=1260050 RepID=A0ABP0CX23_9PEZI